MFLKYLVLVFLSLILSGSSQPIISNDCEIMFRRQQITEYTCKTTGLDLRWIVEPVIGSSDGVIFSINGIIGDTLTFGNIVATQDSRNPVISRLTIMSNPSLPAADVVCLSNGMNDTRPYTNDTFIPIEPVGNIIDHTMDNKTIPINGVNVKYVTLIMEPVPADRTDVDCFLITNSQNDEVMRVEPTNSSATTVLKPGTVTFNVTTVYDCPTQRDTVQYVVVVPSSDEGVPTLVFIWPGADFLIIVILCSVIVILGIILCLKMRDREKTDRNTSEQELPERNTADQELFASKPR